VVTQAARKSLENSGPEKLYLLRPHSVIPLATLALVTNRLALAGQVWAKPRVAANWVEALRRAAQHAGRIQS
jgi:hypothetical protein